MRSLFNLCHCPMKGALATLLSISTLCACGPEPTPAQRWPGSWSEAIYPALYRAMAMHGVRNCGDLVWKYSYNDDRHPDLPELLVYCSIINGESPSAYIVFLRPNEADNAVLGPSNLYPDIPPPERWQKSN